MTTFIYGLLSRSDGKSSTQTVEDGANDGCVGTKSSFENKGYVSEEYPQWEKNQKNGTLEARVLFFTLKIHTVFWSDYFVGVTSICTYELQSKVNLCTDDARIFPFSFKIFLQVRHCENSTRTLNNRKRMLFK